MHFIIFFDARKSGNNWHYVREYYNNKQETAATVTVIMNVTCLFNLCVRVDASDFHLDIRVKYTLVLIALLLWQLIATDHLQVATCYKVSS